jgi:hypothetical protein
VPRERLPALRILDEHFGVALHEIRRLAPHLGCRTHLIGDYTDCPGPYSRTFTSSMPALVIFTFVSPSPFISSERPSGGPSGPAAVKFSVMEMYWSKLVGGALLEGGNQCVTLPCFTYASGRTLPGFRAFRRSSSRAFSYARLASSSVLNRPRLRRRPRKKIEALKRPVLSEAATRDTRCGCWSGPWRASTATDHWNGHGEGFCVSSLDITYSWFRGQRMSRITAS